ncbi:MAG: alkane 1-monooxygenase [Bacteroidetes bacterium]|nr:alkane 1-monooxygenase [Bacteroidota bacterium]
MTSNWRWLKYLVALVIPLHTIYGFYAGGWFLLFPLFLSFLLIPLLELLIPPDSSNMNALQLELEERNPMYDGLLYLLLPLQIFNLFLFLNQVGDSEVSNFDRIVMISCMGLNCGIIGINVGHELGHRTNTFEVILAKTFLLSSLYMHFYIEHNRGHHKRVGTRIDPASARYGENLYFFLMRSIVQSFFSAWMLESKRLKKVKKSSLSFSNQMMHFSFIQLLLLLAIYFFFGKMVLLYFMMAALLGISLLESVNYIEHYGLGRKKMEDGTFAKVKHCHSWNSNHVLGRLALFELSRHSDHHDKASKKYQLLNHHDASPQMPTGYPGMIILALIPPLWFKVMHPIIENEIKRLPTLVKARYS